MSTEHPYGEPHRYLDLPGVSLPYWKIGSGPDLVFVHGWPLDSRTWRNLVGRLSDSHTCHLIDLPGAGLSRWSPQLPPQFHLFPQVVAGAVQLMELERFFFVGHDSGGGFARMSVVHFQRGLSGFVLGNTETPGEYSVLFQRLFDLGKTPLARPLIRTVCALGLTRQFFCLGRRWKDSPLEQELRRHFMDPLASCPGKLEAAVTLLRQARASDFDALSEAHALIRCPVHLIWGKKDPWFPLAHAQNMLAGFAGETRLTVMDKASLLVHEEEPEAFAEAVREMVAAEA